MERILGGSILPNIGQISPQDKKLLERMVRKGHLKKQKLWWPYITHGTKQKTYYVPPWWPTVKV